MPTIKRRAPIKATTDLGPSPGAVFGRGLQAIGGQVAEIAERRRDESDKAQAVEDYIGIKKQYQEENIADRREVIQTEDPNGMSDRVLARGNGFRYEATKDKSKTYSRTMSALINQDISSMTSSAINNEEILRREIGLNKHARTSTEYIQSMEDADLLGYDGFDPVLDLSLEANGMAKTEQSEFIRKESMKNEAKNRFLNADVEEEDYFLDLLASAKEKGTFGTDYKNVEMKFKRSMEAQRAFGDNNIAKQNSQYLRASENKLIASLSQVTQQDPQKMAQVASFKTNQLVEVIMADTSIDASSKAYVVKRIKAMGESAKSEILKPVEDRFEQEFYSVKADIEELGRNRPKTTGDDQADSEAISDYLEDRIALYSQLSDLSAHTEHLNIPQEDRDLIEMELARSANEISTLVGDSEKGYLFRFWKADIDKNDPNRVSTHYEVFEDKMKFGAYGALDPLQQSELRNHVLNGFIEFQKQRVTDRMSNKQVKDFDVMGSAKEAQGFLDSLVREGLKDIVGEDVVKMQDAFIRADNFINSSRSEYDNDTSANKTVFIQSAINHGIPVTSAMAMSRNFGKQDAAAGVVSSGGKETMAPRELKIDDYASIDGDNVVVPEGVNPYFASQKLREIGTPEAISMAEDIEANLDPNTKASGLVALKMNDIQENLEELSYPGERPKRLNEQQEEVRASFDKKMEKINSAFRWIKEQWDSLPEPDMSGGMISVPLVPDKKDRVKPSGPTTFKRTKEADIINPSTQDAPSGSVKSVFPTKHPFVSNDDGSKSNVILGTFEFDGNHVVIPTMVDGKKLSDKEAVSIARENGLQNYPTFDTAKEADRWAEENHSKINEDGEIAVDDADTPAADSEPSGSISSEGNESYGVPPMFTPLVEALKGAMPQDDETIDHISKEEGYREDVYKDTEGFLTAGIGHKLTEEELKKYKLGDIIPKEQISKWFKEDTATAERGAKKIIASYSQLPKKVQTVLKSMTFQMGTTGVSKFEDMIEALNKKPFGKKEAKEASDAMLDSKWAKQTPERAKRQAKIVRNSV